MSDPVRTRDCLVEVRDLEVRFGGRGVLSGQGGPTLRAVTDASFDIRRGEILGLVGESGSGKTTVARAIMRLIEPSSGRITFAGADITHLTKRAMRPFRRRMQMVFQDPYSSLNPRLTARRIVGEAFQVHGIGARSDRANRVIEMLHRVGLPADAMDRYPHEFSGGQRQRIGIARALAARPEFVIADEPVSALDVSVQAQIVNLLLNLQRSLGLTLLFVAHDLGLVQFVSDRIVVLYLGRVMEVGPAEALYSRPRHPYTAALLEAIPHPDPAKRRPLGVLPGEIPSPFAPPSGCIFRTRCPHAIPECARVVPRLAAVSKDHASACIRDVL